MHESDTLTTPLRRFSTHPIWQESYEYYQKKGVNAWSESVPFYITSNNFIAHQYSDIILSLIKETIKNKPESAHSPFVILELGAGTGQLSYLINQRLAEQTKHLMDTPIEYKYIVSDISKENLNFIRNHPNNKPFINNNTLHFATLDIVTENTLTLLNDAAPIDTKNPFIVIANYLFDSLPADVFKIQNERIYDVELNLDENPSGTPLAKEQISPQPYQNTEYNHILNQYCFTIDNSYIPFPIASLKAITNLQSITNDHYLLLLSDKCFLNSDELNELPLPEIDRHGSHSMMVNLDAIAQYTINHNGHAHIPIGKDNLTTATLSCGIDWNHYQDTNDIINRICNHETPGDYYNLYQRILIDITHWELPEITSALAFSKWDSGLYLAMANRINELITNNNSQIIDYIETRIPCILNTHYQLPGSVDINFPVGNFYYAIEEYKTALSYYLLSNKEFPNQPETLYNIGLCHENLNHPEKALDFFDAANKTSTQETS